MVRSRKLRNQDACIIKCDTRVPESETLNLVAMFNEGVCVLACPCPCPAALVKGVREGWWSGGLRGEGRGGGEGVLVQAPQSSGGGGWVGGCFLETCFVLRIVKK